MKVVFLQNVANVARAGEIKNVADGYARNYLIPRRLAARADPHLMQQFEAQLKARARQEAETEAELEALAARIDGQEVTIRAKVGVKDRLYGSVTAADIAAALEQASGTTVDKRRIELENPIRHLGTYEVTVRLSRDITPRIVVTVTEDEA